MCCYIRLQLHCQVPEIQMVDRIIEVPQVQDIATWQLLLTCSVSATSLQPQIRIRSMTQALQQVGQAMAAMDLDTVVAGLG